MTADLLRLKNINLIGQSNKILQLYCKVQQLLQTLSRSCISIVPFMNNYFDKISLPFCQSYISILLYQRAFVR